MINCHEQLYFLDRLEDIFNSTGYNIIDNMGNFTGAIEYMVENGGITAQTNRTRFHSIHMLADSILDTMKHCKIECKRIREIIKRLEYAANSYGEDEDNTARFINAYNQESEIKKIPEWFLDCPEKFNPNEWQKSESTVNSAENKEAHHIGAKERPIGEVITWFESI